MLLPLYILGSLVVLGRDIDSMVTNIKCGACGVF